MTLYIKYKIKDILTDPELLGWSIGFIEFWVIMWVFVFGSFSGEYTGEALKYAIDTYVSMGYSFLGVLAVSTASIGLTYGIFYSSVASRYITKFTKLSPLKFLIEEFLGSLIALLVITYIIFLSVYGLSIFKWGVYPHITNQIGVFIDILLVGIGYYWFSYTLSLTLIVSRRTKALGMTSFIPLIIGFTSYFQLWVNLGYMVYIVPFASAPALIIYHSLNTIPPTGEYLKWLSGGFVKSIDLRLGAASLLTWITIFFILSIILMRKSRGVPIEEIRL